MKNIRRIFLLFSFMMAGYSSFSQIRITFTVDVTGFPVYAGGVHIAGEFQTTNCISITEQWEPAAAGSLMTLLYDSTYGIDVIFPSSSAGLPFQWEFVRDNVWNNAIEDPSEGNPGDPSNFFNDSCANYDFTNREIIIPSSCASYNAVWNKCAFLEPPSPPIITQNGYVLTSSPSLYYQWQLNGVNIPGATNQSYEVLQTGYYTVIISDEGNCVASSTIYVEITGIEDLISGQNFLVTPNPAADHFTIACSTVTNENADVIITIIDMLGKKLVVQESSIIQGKLSEEIHLGSQFTSGLYLVIIKANDSLFAQQLIVQS